jgi:hypothetical protein
MKDILKIATSDGRVVVCCSISTALAIRMPSHFAVLVLARDKIEGNNVRNMAGALIDLGCVEFCCAGAEAEWLHDELDYVIEDKGTLGVVTTWYESEAEACQCFLFAAGGAQLELLAIVLDHPGLLAALEALAKASGTQAQSRA